MMPFREHLRAEARGYWVRMLALTHGNVSLCAQIARVNRTHVYKLLRRYGIAVQRRKYRGTWTEQGL